jgi:hypothetical protein
MHGDLGILELSCPDDLEVGALDLVDDLLEAEPFEIVRLEGGSREQKCESPK